MKNTGLLNKVKNATKTHGFNISNISQFQTGQSTLVFRGILDNEREVVIRISQNPSWPEEGKLLWINDELSKAKIPNPDILFLTRKDEVFKHGFMIQELIEGEIVRDLAKKNEDIYFEYYKQLGKLMKKVHKIELLMYGYIGDGTGNHETFLSYIDREVERLYERNDEISVEVDIEIEEYRDIVLKGLKPLKSLKPVLNHNDLSPDNAIQKKDGEIVLIDWDNAVSSVWINDFAVMTYWMRYEHEDDSLREELISVFLDNYETDIGLNELKKYEKYFHFLQSFNLLRYYLTKNRMDSYTRTLEYFNQLSRELS